MKKDIIFHVTTFFILIAMSSCSGNAGPEFLGGDDDTENLGGGDGDGDADADSDSDADADTGPACGNVTGEGTLTARPVDIIISIDNSGSMGQEINTVQDRINIDLAETLSNSGIDYRVILVSRYGHVDQPVDDSNNPVCIGTPLGAGDCPSTSNIPMLALPPASLPVPQIVRFYHHSTDIRSSDMWCKLLTSLDSLDEEKCANPNIGGSSPPDNPKYCTINSGFGTDTSIRQINGNDWNPLFANGWEEHLRTGSYKVFVAITDDAPAGNECIDYRALAETVSLSNDGAGALNFDKMLRLKAPEHFGVYDASNPDTNRNYTWHSIIGFSQGEETNTSTPTDRAVGPEEPIMADYPCTANVSSGTNSSTNVGGGYQHLSIMTGGLRYPSCLTDNFDAIFDAIAQEVIDVSIVPCVFDIPDISETTGTIDLNNVTVEYKNGSSGEGTVLNRAADDDEANCAANGFYYDDSENPTQILICPATCEMVRADEKAKINIDFGCLTIVQ